MRQSWGAVHPPLVPLVHASRNLAPHPLFICTKWLLPNLAPPLLHTLYVTLGSSLLPHCDGVPLSLDNCVMTLFDVQVCFDCFNHCRYHGHISRSIIHLPLSMFSRTHSRARGFVISLRWCLIESYIMVVFDRRCKNRQAFFACFMSPVFYHGGTSYYSRWQDLILSSPLYRPISLQDCE